MADLKGLHLYKKEDLEIIRSVTDPEFDKWGGGQNAEGLWTALIPPVGPGQNHGGDPGATPSKAPRFGVFKNTF